MTYPLNLLTRTLGRVTFSPVAAKSATGLGNSEMLERSDAHNQRLFLRLHHVGVEKPSMGLCGAAFGQAGISSTSSFQPRTAPTISDWKPARWDDNPKLEATIMTTLTILASTVRVLDGKYSLNDLHKASSDGKQPDKRFQPSNFLRLEQTQALIKEIQSSDMRSEPVKTFKGGNAPGTYVCRELVYAYAMWVSPKFNLAVIRAFDSLQASSSPAPKTTTTEPGLALPAPKTTIVTTIVQGQAPVTQTFYGDVAVVADTTVLTLMDEMTGAMQWMADAYGRLDAARMALVEATAVPFDAAGSSSRRAEAAREFLRDWRA